LTVPPEVRQRIDGAISEAQQQVTMWEEERAKVKAHLEEVEPERKAFAKREVGPAGQQINLYITQIS